MIIAQATHVGDAVDWRALELAVVELIDGGGQVGGGLVLDEAEKCQPRTRVVLYRGYSPFTGPFAAAIAVHLAVDDIKARLARKVLEVLYADILSLVLGSMGTGTMSGEDD